MWKDIKDYEGRYEVSTEGSVRNKITGYILKPEVTEAGHLRVEFKICGIASRFYVHRLVAEAFIPNPLNLPLVHHLDEIPAHCWVDNLEWSTVQKNTIASCGRKVEQYKDGVLVMIHDSLRSAASSLGTSNGATHISKCCKGTMATYKGYTWKYHEKALQH